MATTQPDVLSRPHAPDRASGSGIARDVLFIRDLQVDAFIGVYDHERSARQRVRFDVEIATVEGYAQIVRETGDYVCYAETATFIIDQAAREAHVELVESWAEEVAAFVLRNPLAASVVVSVQKLDAFEAAAGVGVRIERRAEGRA